MGKTVAVVLSGSGFLDGSEIHEAVSCLMHLSRRGIAYQCFAPDAPQADVINHATHKPTGSQTRNMMVEAARIARGRIAPLSSLDASKYDGLVMPGGFGAAKNLCNFASKGADCDVLPDVASTLRAFHGAKKPIAMCCIAPVIAARVLGTRMGGKGCRVTIGTDAATADAIATMGSMNVGRSVHDAFVDEPNRLVTTPAYMFDAKPHEVFDGVGAMIDAFAKLLGL